MLTALDLTSSQMSRVIAQAVRLRAKLEIEPYPDACSHLIWASVEGRENNCLRVDLVDGYEEGLPNALVGAYCDVRTVLSGQLYLFTTTVLELHDRTNPPRLLLAEPENMQVANRRRFVRKAPADPVTIELISKTATRGMLAGDLWNIGANGLAVRVTLPWSGEPFDLEASVCSKGNTPEPDHLITGLEFCTPQCAASMTDAQSRPVGPICSASANPDQQQAELDRLREIIAEETNRLLELEGGA
jgi:hypothetical protein